jgi:hypothetical protein
MAAARTSGEAWVEQAAHGRVHGAAVLAAEERERVQVCRGSSAASSVASRSPAVRSSSAWAASASSRYEWMLSRRFTT